MKVPDTETYIEAPVSAARAVRVAASDQKNVALIGRMGGNGRASEASI